jgi:hypothetical protein
MTAFELYQDLVMRENFRVVAIWCFFFGFCALVFAGIVALVMAEEEQEPTEYHVKHFLATVAAALLVGSALFYTPSVPLGTASAITGLGVKTNSGPIRM